MNDLYVTPELARAIGQIQTRELEDDWATVWPKHFANAASLKAWNELRLLMLDYSRCVFE